MRTLFDAFYASIREESASPIPPAEILRVTAIMDDIFRSCVESADTSHSPLAAARPRLFARGAVSRMRTFVTGGAGFLGRRLVARLLGQGHEVVCLLRHRTDAAALRVIAANAQSGRLDIVRAALGKPDTYRSALAGVDVVFHVAAEMRGAVAVLFMTNVVATRALLEASRQAGVGRIVLVSSLGVYGAGTLQRHALLDESCPLDPHPHLRDGYSHSRIAEEHAAWEAREQSGVPLVVVRPGVIYGPGRDWIGSRVGLRLGNVVLKMGGRQLVPYHLRGQLCRRLMSGWFRARRRRARVQHRR